jgi:hypothetical protein
MKSLLYMCLLVCGVAHAAKVTVLWTNPSQNTDGSSLTNLTQVRIEWGSCVGDAFGAVQAGVAVPTTTSGAELSAFIYPTGLTRVCIRAYAINAVGVSSDPSSVAIKNLLPSVGKPVTLGQPVIL